jgi:pilus assembly protein CpaB
MNRRLIGVFAFALAVASFTSFVVYRLLLSHLQTPAIASHLTLSVSKLVVASRDLQVGTLIKDSDLSERDWTGAVPKQTVRTKAELIGRGVTSPVFENEPFLEQRLAPKGAGAGLASTIPIGMRALAVRVNDVVGLAGFVLPGMHVDVLVAGDVPGDDTNAGRRCRTVLQNLEVLSVGQHIEKNPEGKPESAEVVNLLVTPDQAETLNLASSEAKVQLVLRNPLDTQAQGTHGTSVASLFGQKIVSTAPKPVAATEMPPVAMAPAPPLPTVEVFSGAHKADQVVDVRGGSR